MLQSSREGKGEVEAFECTLALVWSGMVPWTMEWGGSGSGEVRERGEREKEATTVRKGGRNSALHVGLCHGKPTKTRLGWA